MDYKKIHKALKSKGFTWVMAAEAIGCTPNYLMIVCRRTRDSRRIAKAVSLLLEKPVEEVFPDKKEAYTSEPTAGRDEHIAAARKRLEKAGLAA